MGLSPPSDRAVFADVQRFYEADIAPLSRGAERRRRHAVRDAALIVIAAAVAILFFTRIHGDTGAVLAIIAGMVGLAAAGARINKTRGEIAEEWIGRLAAHLGFSYARTASRPSYCEPFQRFRLIRRFNRERWEDEIVGAHGGVAFSLIEAHLKYRTGGRRKRTRTVFHGQLIAIDFPRRFSGTTIVKRDAGLLNALGKPGATFSRVGLAASNFEKAFEAWSTDQVEARALLDPVMLERFDELERLFGGAKLRAAFEGGKLYIALEVGDRLNVGSMFTPIDGGKRFERLLKEFDLIFDLIDVATQRAAPLNEALSIKHVRAG